VPYMQRPERVAGGVVTVKFKEVKHTTPKAALILIVESSAQLMLTTGEPPKEKEIWVPKSIIQNKKTWEIAGHLDLPEWFCEKEVRW